MLQTFSNVISSGDTYIRKKEHRYNRSIGLRSRWYFIPFVDEIAIEFCLSNFIGSSWQNLVRKIRGADRGVVVAQVSSPELDK